MGKRQAKHEASVFARHTKNRIFLFFYFQHFIYDYKTKGEFIMNNKRITMEEMEDYGYTWRGMYPLNMEQAIKAWKKAVVYKLYPDGTEAEVDTLEEIKKFDGIFGIENDTYHICFPVVTSMDLVIEMDRTIDDSHYISPGGFELSNSSTGDTVAFDFKSSECIAKDGNQISFSLKWLDKGCFPESEPGLSKEFLKNCVIEDCYIYTGEDNEDPDIHPVRILRWSFDFSDGSNIELPKKTLNMYHYEIFTAESLYKNVYYEYLNGDTMLNQQFFSVPVNKISKSELLGVYEKLLKIINSDLICRIQSPVIGTDGTISGKLLPLYPPEFENEIFSGIYSDFLREISERNDLFRLMNWEIDSEKETMLSHGEPLDFIP